MAEPNPLGMVASFSLLDKIFAGFEGAARDLQAAIGVPICISNCGKCCEVNVPLVRDIEAKYAVSWILGNGLVDKVAERCEGWLLDRMSALTSYGIKPGAIPEGLLPGLREEWDYVAHRTPCPMLLEDKSCLIYGARPMVCRAAGVTTAMPVGCPRPLGYGESLTSFARAGGPGVEEIKRNVSELLRTAENQTWLISSFLPTALYMSLRPQKFAAYIEDSKIATAKIMQTFHNLGILWQDQLNEVWDMQQLTDRKAIKA